MSKVNKRKIGKKYEDIAATFLQNKGYEIIKRNYFSQFGEIDIIAKDDGYIIFVEVKYRKNSTLGNAEGAVNSAKMQRIRNTALKFLIDNFETEEVPCRFDVVAFTGNQIHLIKDAF